MPSLKVESLSQFVKRIHQHPIYTELKQPEPWVRFCLSYSEYFKSQMIKKKIWSETWLAENDPWHFTDLQFTPSEKLSMRVALQKAVGAAIDCYYSVNLTAFDQTSRVRQEGGLKRANDLDITNVMFIPLDWDHELPCGLGKIFTMLQVAPWLTVRSSHRDGKKKFQALVAIDPADSREFEKYRRTMYRFADLVGADLGAMHKNQVLRVPGTINWKRTKETGQHSGYCELIETVVHERLTGEVLEPKAWLLKDLDRALAKFENTDFCQTLIGSRPKRKTKLRLVGAGDEETSWDQLPKLSEYTWQQALERSQGEKVSAVAGNRHQSMLSWASGLAHSIGRGRISLDAAIDTLTELAANACEDGGEPEAAKDKELRNLVAYLQKCEERDRDSRKTAMSEIMGGPKNKTQARMNYEQIGAVTEADIEGIIGLSRKEKITIKREMEEERRKKLKNKAKLQREGYFEADPDDISISGMGGSTGVQAVVNVDNVIRDSANGRIAQMFNAIDIWVNLFIGFEVSLDNPMAESVVDEGDGVKMRAPLDPEFVEFLVSFLLSMRKLKDSDGFIEDTARLILARMLQRSLLIGIHLCVPWKGKSAWGTNVNFLYALHEKQCVEAFNILIERLAQLCYVYRDQLKTHERIRHQLQGVKKAARRTTEIIDLSGKRGGDDKALLTEFKSKASEFFTVPLSKRNKDIVREAVIAKIVAWRTGPGGGEDETDTKVLLQNGMFEVSTGRWLAGDLWRTGLCTMHTHFDLVLAKRISKAFDTAVARPDRRKDRKSSAVFGAEKKDLLLLADMIEKELPRFHAFIAACFPDDPASWMIALLLIGYCTLPYNPFQAVFNLHGMAGAGKSTLAFLIQKIIGDQAASVTEYDRIPSEKEGVFNLIGKTMTVVDEIATDETDARTHKAVFRKLKTITGGGKVVVRGIYSGELREMIGAKFMLVSNPPLLFGGDSDLGAGKRRLVPLAFEHTQIHNNPVSGLDLLIAREEADQLMTFGLMLLRKRWALGMKMFEVADSKALTEGKKQVDAISDPIGAFLNAVIIPGDPGSTVMPLSLIRAVIEAYARKHTENYAPGSHDGVAAALNRFKGQSIEWLNRSITQAMQLRGIAVDGVKGRDRVRVKSLSGNHRLRVLRGVRLDVNALVRGGYCELNSVAEILVEQERAAAHWCLEKRSKVRDSSGKAIVGSGVWAVGNRTQHLKELLTERLLG